MSPSPGSPVKKTDIFMCSQFDWISVAAKNTVKGTCISYTINKTPLLSSGPCYIWYLCTLSSSSYGAFSRIMLLLVKDKKETE
ncbi:hypothetical protein GUJ93_ZPchr0006g44731 [Zizania palustris]|uniref:Uncharacterized protein n=1 Tax=Zizania palustris TaxID=103762 RepID=A0A8J5SJS7_ZIZPA|nr:hypothetical protein GUJ93_ZPchr0006g44731 [Zizania palustris]